MEDKSAEQGVAATRLQPGCKGAAAALQWCGQCAWRHGDRFIRSPLPVPLPTAKPRGEGETALSRRLNATAPCGAAITDGAARCPYLKRGTKQGRGGGDPPSLDPPLTGLPPSQNCYGGQVGGTRGRCNKAATGLQGRGSGAATGRQWCG
jgi:hypothetical protein